jgi:hypothetical protein
MTTIIGYGEDALTLWALSQRMQEILAQLGDNSSPADALVFYRPSCGRGQRLPQGELRSFFGEFDAIIGTTQGVYLVEAKVPSSSGVGRFRVTLKRAQVHRHKILRTYLTLWRARKPTSWEEFRDAASEAFGLEHKGWRLVENDLTKANLRFVFDRLTACGSTTKNILLLIGPVGWKGPKEPPEDFELVTIAYESFEGAAFFDTQIAIQPRA